MAEIRSLKITFDKTNPLVQLVNADSPQTQGNPSYPPQSYPPSNKGLIAGLIKGNQWLITLNKAGYFLGGS